MKTALRLAVESYNSTPSLAFENKLTPAEAIDPANFEKAAEIKLRKEAKLVAKYQDHISKANSRFKLHDIVRLRVNQALKPNSVISGHFTKEHQYRLSSDLYRIIKIIPSGGLYSYKLETLDGSEQMPGSYTSQMLYSVRPLRPEADQ